MSLPDPATLRSSAARRMRMAKISMACSLFFSILFLVFLILLRGKLSGLGADVAVEGLVTDDKGDPVINASVYITAGDVSKELTTDAAGRFNASGLPAGDTIVRVNRSGYSDSVHRLSTYNAFGESDRTYSVAVDLVGGNGTIRTGEYSSSRLSSYCMGFILFFTVTTAIGAAGILALIRGRTRPALGCCIAGMLSVGMGLATAFSTLAALNILRYERDMSLSRKIEKNREKAQNE